MALILGTTSSEKQQEKSFTFRISSLTKGVSSMSAERRHSLPVKPVADSATSSSEEHIIDMSNMDVSFYNCHYKLGHVMRLQVESGQLQLFSHVRLLSV